MAERRMFSKKITDSDAFIEMPSATQALYFHLNQAADDDGFNNQISVAMMKAHASADDLKILLMKRFIIRFESGVIVIKHWRMHNTLRTDRYTPTSFQDELAQLDIKENKSYTLTDNGCQVVAKLETQYSIGKYSIDKDSIDKDILHGAKETPCSSPTILTLILNTKEEYPITQQSIDEWTELYPGVNVIQQLKSMKGWLIANPARRKTKKGILRFINNWLTKEQNRGGDKSGSNKESEPICKDTDKYSEIGFTL